MAVGAGEGFVVAGISDDNVAVGSLRDGVNQALLQVVQTHAELGLEGFGLVFDTDDGLVVTHRNVGVGDAWLSHQQNDAGTLGGIDGALDAEILYLVVGMADAGGIDEAEGDVAKLDAVLDGVARGTLNVADDGAVFAKEGV